MSGILKIFTDRMILGHPTWWIVLDCGHWVHWLGPTAPPADDHYDCPSCQSRSNIVAAPEPAA